jgi:hypothetical protein
MILKKTHFLIQNSAKSGSRIRIRKKRCGSGTRKYQNFLQDLDTDPELKVLDPDLALDLILIRNHQH